MFANKTLINSVMLTRHETHHSQTGRASGDAADKYATFFRHGRRGDAQPVAFWRAARRLDAEQLAFRRTARRLDAEPVAQLWPAGLTPVTVDARAGLR